MTVTYVGNVTSTTPATFVVTDYAVSCPQCGKKLSELCSRPWKFRCPRCKAVIQPPNLTPVLES